MKVARRKYRRKSDTLFIAALVSGASIKAAAATAGLSEPTAHRRLSDPCFQRQLDGARRSLIEQTTTRVAVITDKALATLDQLLDANEDGIRLAAAKTIIDTGMRLRNEHALMARLAALEDRYEHEEFGSKTIPTGARYPALTARAGANP